MSDVIATAQQGDPLYEKNEESQIIFTNDIAITPNDSESVPTPIDTTLNGTFIRLRSNGNIVFWGSGIWNLINGSQITLLKKIVLTYAQMIPLAVGIYPIDFLVLNDENKGQENTTYNFYPSTTTPTLMWFASIKENI